MNYCEECGNRISEGGKFCRKCGGKRKYKSSSYHQRLDGRRNSVQFTYYPPQKHQYLYQEPDERRRKTVYSTNYPPQTLQKSQHQNQRIQVPYHKPQKKNYNFIIWVIVILIVLGIILILIIPNYSNNPDKIDITVKNTSDNDVQIYIIVDNEEYTKKFLNGGEEVHYHTELNKDKEHKIEIYFYSGSTRYYNAVTTNHNIRFVINPDLIIHVYEV